MCHQEKLMLRRWVRASRVPDTGGESGIGDEESKQKEIALKSCHTTILKICIQSFGVGELRAHLLKQLCCSHLS